MRCESHVLKMETSPLEFSRNGEFALYSSHDGVLKLWETATNSLKNDYKPSSHLSATCTCLSWAPSSGTDFSRKRKKRKSGSGASSDVAAAQAINELCLVAIGTASGNILLYSVVKGDLHSQLPDGHSDTVNGICWDVDSNSLYSCSSDHHIVHWEVTSAKIKHKWKADKGPVHSICRCSSSHLLSAGRSIKLWDLNTRQVIKTFTGHATEVFKMIHLPASRDDISSIENTYFLSAAVNDRLVNAWQIDTSSKDKSAVASFSLPDEPVSLHISRPDSRDRLVILVVITQSGQALLFECTLNGKLKKPLQPKLTIQIATPGSKTETPKPVPILAAYICDENEKNLILMHGNYLKPTFEKVSCNTSQSDLCLVREDPMKTTLHKDASVSKVKTPEVSKDVTVLAPGFMAPSTMSQDPAKRRKRKPSVGDMTIEERLSAISVDQPRTSNSSATQPPKADTLARLLTQGLQSQDGKILNNVLQNRNTTLIRNTVKKLPVQMIIPLIQELTKRLHGHAQSGGSQLLWIKMVLTLHTSYLMTFPEIIDTFSTLYQMMDSRVNMFGKLSRLQGKLDLMLSQISTQTQEEEEEPVTQQPLLQYEEESSDEDLDDMAIGPSASDSEENWEDFSDQSEMDVQDDSDSKG